MKRSIKIIESAIGLVPMLLLWVIGSLSYRYFFANVFMSNENIFMPYEEALVFWDDAFISMDNKEAMYPGVIIPMAVIAIMPVLLQIYAAIGKVFNLKLMYIFAAVGMGVPAVAYIFTNVTLEDGNILHWIYAFTIGLVFLPISKLAYPVLVGAANFSCVFIGQGHRYNDIGLFEIDLFVSDVCKIYLLAIVISVIIFLLVRTKTILVKPQGLP